MTNIEKFEKCKRSLIRKAGAFAKAAPWYEKNKWTWNIWDQNEKKIFIPNEKEIKEKTTSLIKSLRYNELNSNTTGRILVYIDTTSRVIFGEINLIAEDVGYMVQND